MATAAEHLRVLTMNILGPANPDWERRSHLLTDTLRQVGPDIVALQEVPTAGGSGVVDLLLGPGYFVSGFSRTADDGVGGAVATRWPHEVVEEVDQRCTPRSQDFAWCATQLVAVDTPVGRTLVAHHKPSWPFGYELEREHQAVNAAQAIERYAPDFDHALVLGDFDATPDASSVQFWRGRRSFEGMSVCYQDAWETLHPGEAGHTFSSENPLVRAGEVSTAVSRRIDYILIRSGLHGPSLQVQRCSRVLDLPRGGVWASDHYGVLADLSRPPHEPATWGRFRGRRRAAE